MSFNPVRHNGILSMKDIYRQCEDKRLEQKPSCTQIALSVLTSPLILAGLGVAGFCVGIPLPMVGFSIAGAFYLHDQNKRSNRELII